MAKEYDLQALLDVRQNQLGLIFADSNSIDTKALAILGADLAILVFVGQASLKINHWWVGTIMIGCYGLSILFGILASWIWPYIGAGVNLNDHPEYLQMDKQALVLQLISDTELAISNNRRLNGRRWRFVLAAFTLTLIGTIVLFVIM
jgi:hypothetical protein